MIRSWVSAQDFDTVIDVDIKGMANVIRHFVSAMAGQQSGFISVSLNLSCALSEAIFGCGMSAY